MHAKRRRLHQQIGRIEGLFKIILVYGLKPAMIVVLFKMPSQFLYHTVIYVRNEYLFRAGAQIHNYGSRRSTGTEHEYIFAFRLKLKILNQ